MSSASDPDFDFETATGVPEKLPAGERIMWQGAPQWASLVRHVFHADKIAAYFAIAIGVRMVLAWNDGVPATEMLAGTVALLTACALALAIVALLAWQAVRTTIYTLTTRRIIMRFGMAFPLTVTVPLTRLAGAHLARRRDGSGDIALSPDAGARISYLMLWPHARAWRIMNPEPTLRSVPDADQVAQLVGEALQATVQPPMSAVVRVRRVGTAASSGVAHQPTGALAAAE